MNILIYNWRDIRNGAEGGAEVLTHEIAERPVLRGHKITLFTSSFPGCKKNEMIDVNDGKPVLWELLILKWEEI